MTRKLIDPELIELAEEHRHLLPRGFNQEADAVEAALSKGQTLLAFRSKGRGKAKKSNVGIRAAVLEELRLFLCTEDVRYKDLQAGGKSLTKQSVLVIAGWVAATLGITTGIATACVSFLALAILRLGVATFCRLNPPPAADPKGASKTSKGRTRS
jgi:hypothetical protein